MSEISLPIDRMKEIAQQIISDADSLANDTIGYRNRIHNTSTGLPGTMQETVSNFLTPMHESLMQMLLLRQSIGEELGKAADLATEEEDAITGAF